MLRAEGVTVRRGAITALQGIHLDLPAGQVFGVLGPNGAGKSTLLGALCGELDCSTGQVLLHGRRSMAGRTSSGHGGWRCCRRVRA
ncbi:hemin importer ATP-binding subunit [Pseudomonas sp. BAY1663]|nr:hemin importer ATP-binding subunit [Pseudomonas sp. BAY1663]